MTDKTCITCAFGSAPTTSTVCQACTQGGIPTAPNWRALLPGWRPQEKGVGSTDAPVKSDGSTASYYELPAGAKELQDLISYRDMNAQLGEIFRECYRYGIASHSDRLRGAKKLKFYAEAEIARLEKYGD
jgi:hypothetical protein